MVFHMSVPYVLYVIFCTISILRSLYPYALFVVELDQELVPPVSGRRGHPVGILWWTVDSPWAVSQRPTSLRSIHMTRPDAMVTIVPPIIIITTSPINFLKVVHRHTSPTHTASSNICHRIDHQLQHSWSLCHIKSDEDNDPEYKGPPLTLTWEQPAQAGQKSKKKNFQKGGARCGQQIRIRAMH